MSRIMIVDDEESILKALCRVLRIAPCAYGNKIFNLEVESFSSPKLALEQARHESYDLFISDFRMPEMDGIEFLKGTKVLQPDAARLILSGYADLNALVRAVNEVGIERFIGKPWNDYDLMSAIGQALATRQRRNWKLSGWKVLSLVSPKLIGGRMARCCLTPSFSRKAEPCPSAKITA